MDFGLSYTQTAFRSLITGFLESSCQAEDTQKLHVQFLCLDGHKLRLLKRMTQTPTFRLSVFVSSLANVNLSVCYDIGVSDFL